MVGRAEPITSSATYCHHSVLRFQGGLRGRLLFPGHEHYDAGSMGFVRAASRAANALLSRRDVTAVSRRLPWRDYPHELLTPTDQVLRRAGYGPHARNRLLLSARNVVNEFGHRVRIHGIWYGRGADPPVDQTWPVLEIRHHEGRFRRLSEIGDGDVLTGVPVVRDGMVVRREELLAWCSDQAHVFDVHPDGLRGPIGLSRAERASVWSRLSDAWQLAKDEHIPDRELASRQESLARELGVMPSRDLLHAILGHRGNEEFIVLCAVGSFEELANRLVAAYGVQDAIVLDNGGSVGPVYVPTDSVRGQVLTAAPNRRSAGTVFLDLWMSSFPQPDASLFTQAAHAGDE